MDARRKSASRSMSVETKVSYRILILFLCVLVGGSAQAQDNLIVEQSSDNFILQQAQKWGEVSRYGDLKSLPIDSSDVEIRLWSGFGVRGTRAIIHKRTGGVWQSAYSVLPWYRVETSDSAAVQNRSFPPCSADVFEKRCTKQQFSGPDEAYFIFTCPEFSTFSGFVLQAEYEQIWNQLSELEVLEVPLAVERNKIYMDGFVYVLEVKTSNHYRASVIRHLESDLPVDKQIQAIAEIMFSVITT